MQQWCWTELSKYIEQRHSKTYSVIVCGMKGDRRTSPDVATVDQAVALQFSDSIHAKYCECSALTSNGINEVVYAAVLGFLEGFRDSLSSTNAECA